MRPYIRLLPWVLLLETKVESDEEFIYPFERRVPARLFKNAICGNYNQEMTRSGSSNDSRCRLTVNEEMICSLRFQPCDGIEERLNLLELDQRVDIRA